MCLCMHAVRMAGHEQRASYGVYLQACHHKAPGGAQPQEVPTYLSAPWYPMLMLHRMPVAKVILAYQARGSVEFQEFNAYLCADGTLELGSVCDKFGLRSIELDGVLVPGDATHSPETYAPGMRIQVSGSIQLAAGQ